MSRWNDASASGLGNFTKLVKGSGGKGKQFFPSQRLEKRSQLFEICPFPYACLVQSRKLRLASWLRYWHGLTLCAAGSSFQPHDHS